MASEQERAKKALARRLSQNKGVKHGTVRTGAGGKFVRKYNSKTGRWDKISSAAGTGYGRGKKPSQLSSAPAKKVTQSTAPSATVSSSRGNAKFTPIQPPKVTRVTDRKAAASEGTRNKAAGYSTRSQPRSTSRIGGRVERTVFTNRPSDFPKGTKLQLQKQKSKDAQGRSVYRYVDASRTTATPGRIKKYKKRDTSRDWFR